MSAPTWIGVAVLGGAGAIARFVLDSGVMARIESDFPFGTLVVNGSGALLLGLLHGIGTGGSTLLLAGTALLGSYTTFSTWMLETHRLAEEGETGAAARNILLSLALGIAAVAFGDLIGAAL